MKLKPEFEEEQISTEPVGIEEIMASPYFALGVADARAGRPYRDGYQTWHINAMWNYERGRQFAKLVPASVILKRNGEITHEAMTWGRRQFKDIV